MSSIKDALRVIAAEKRIEELGSEIDELGDEIVSLAKRVTELDEKLDAMIAVASQPRPAQTAQSHATPRPVERR